MNLARISLRRLCFLFACLLAMPVVAQSEPPQLYQVELLLFRQLDAVAKDAWPSDSRTQVPRNARTLPPLEGAEHAAANDFHRVHAEALHLHRAWQNLQSAGDFEPLLYMGWRQSHALLRTARRVRLDDEIVGLSGFLALRLGNRLVAEMDLTLDAVVPEPDPLPHWLFADSRRLQAEPAATTPNESDLTPQGFRLHQRRTIRLGENHYFDHPAFGVILRVVRVEPDAMP